VNTSEERVWAGSPSHIINLPVYAACALFVWLVVPLFIGVWKWLVLKYVHYELTTERLRMRQGVLNKELDDVELYRVRDYRLEQPLMLRLFSLSNITLRTTDESHPVLVLRGIRNGEWVREQIRIQVEACRVKKRVRAIDIEAP
jgi:uncharacterized membrane protein YdbT with pleckstrin-like domain